MIIDEAPHAAGAARQLAAPHPDAPVVPLLFSPTEAAAIRTLEFFALTIRN